MNYINDYTIRESFILRVWFEFMLECLQLKYSDNCVLYIFPPNEDECCSE
jgi:hypothetical protein